MVQPIETFPLFILFCLLIYKFVSNINVAIIISAVSITSSFYVAQWTLGSHELGFLLIITLLCIFLKVIQESHHIKAPYAFLVIIIILATNAVSYKSIFSMLMIVLGLLLIQVLFNLPKMKPKTNELKLNTIFLIGIVAVLTFNRFVFDVFIPEFVTYYDFSYSSGIDKLFQLQYVSQHSPLDSFHQLTPVSVNYVTVFRSVLMITIILVFVLFAYKFKFDRERKIIFATLFSAITTFIVYDMLGIVQTALMSMVAFIFIAIIIINKKNLYRKIGIIMVLMLVVSNCIVAVNVGNGSYQANQKIDTSTEHLVSSTGWSANHLFTDNDASIYSDVFTRGFINSEYSKIKGNTTYPVDVLSDKEIEYILKLNDTNNDDSSYYILNNHLSHFSIMGWETFMSWDDINAKCPINPNASCIYSNINIKIIRSE
jgi:hypothetical protein